MLSFTKQGNKMFPEINDFFIFCDYFLSFYRFIFSPYCLLLVTWGYFLQVIAFLSKEKYISWTAKFPLDFRQSFWRKRIETQKEMNDRVAFVFLWLMYCMVYMFTECICLVMLTKWMTKKKNEFWCAIWKFALASLFMFFSVLSKSQVVFQSCMSTTFSSPPLPSPSLELRISSQEPEAEPCSSDPGGIK